jgi:thioredoxin-like negative regulator of GroEL
MRYLEVTAATVPAFKKEAKGKWVVFHHMQGCMHCVMFSPVWNQAKAMCAKTPGLNMADVEYGAMSALPPSMQKVMGFPTVMVYDNMKPVHEFSGPRDVATVTAFLKAQAVAPASPGSKTKKTPAAKAKASAKK